MVAPKVVFRTDTNLLFESDLPIGMMQLYISGSTLESHVVKR